MLTARLFDDVDVPHILCLGAHCDDIEIGCGGTLLSLGQQYPHARVTWVVMASTEARRMEAEKGAVAFAGHFADLDVQIFDFQDGFLSAHVSEVKATFEAVKKRIDSPDLIFTHQRDDRHQDHRQVCELTWNTFRNHLILEYEIPKWDGDLGRPNAYYPLPDTFAHQKIRELQAVYNSQQTKDWFTDDLFWSLMRIRGMECRAESNVAEAFYTYKWQFS